jgi:ribonuclease T1
VKPINAIQRITGVVAAILLSLLLSGCPSVTISISLTTTPPAPAATAMPTRTISATRTPRASLTPTPAATDDSVLGHSTDSRAQATATRSPTPTRTLRTTRTPTPAANVPSTIDGHKVVTPNELPKEARDTLARIDQGGPFPYRQDGVIFQNREGHLPRKSNGYYHEYTVITPGSPDRGARRIVTGANGEFYYTDDHYNTFMRVIRS